MGAFAGLPEGALFDISGQSFSVSYLGGDGNGVVLTATAGPSVSESGATALLLALSLAALVLLRQKMAIA